MKNTKSVLRGLGAGVAVAVVLYLTATGLSVVLGVTAINVYRTGVVFLVLAIIVRAILADIKRAKRRR